MDNQFELPKEGVRIYNPDSGWQTGPESPIASSADTSIATRAKSMDDDRDGDHADPDDAPDAAYDESSDADPREAGRPAAGPMPLPSDQTDPLASDAEEIAPPIMPMPSGVGAGFRSRRTTNGDRVYTARSEPFVSAAAAAAQTVKPYPRPMAASQGASSVEEGSETGTLVPQTQAAALARVGDSLDSLFTVIQRATVHQVVDGNAPSWRDVANISRHLEDRLNTRQHLLKELHSVDQEIRETRQDLLLTLNALSEYEQQNLQAASMRASISAVAAKVIAKRFAESGGE